jgi:hypothetical protein
MSYLALKDVEQVSPHPEDKDPGAGLGPINTGKSDPMYGPAVVHDQRYLTQETSRKDADLIFLELMEAIASSTKNPVKRGARYVQAYTYYGLVRAFGWIPWNLRRWRS